MSNDPKTEGVQEERVVNGADKIVVGYGARSLNDPELISAILGIGGQRGMILGTRVAQTINLRRLDNVPTEELLAIEGITRRMAIQLQAAAEFGRRLWPNEAPLIRGPEQIYEQCEDIRVTLREHFVGFYLNARHQVLLRDVISIGSLSASIVHPREVFKPAISLSAASIVLAHNHPSGDPTPSEEDLAITRRLHEAGRMLGIELVDHVVVARDSFVSMRERKLLRN